MQSYYAFRGIPFHKNQISKFKKYSCHTLHNFYLPTKLRNLSSKNIRKPISVKSNHRIKRIERYYHLMYFVSRSSNAVVVKSNAE